MASSEFDIIFVADARFPGGTSTALATEIGAAAKAGFSAGLLHVHGPVLKKAHPFHPELRAAIDTGRVTWLDPEGAASCRLLIVHHPMIFPKPPVQRLRLRAERSVIVAHHPPFDGAGKRQYDIAKQIESVERSFHCRPVVAPVGPAVRRQFALMPQEDAVLTPSDWHNLIDLEAWPARPFRPFSSPVVIGRHARPDVLKWPDTREEILAAYPASEDFRVRVLGMGAFLRTLLGTIPPNWNCLPFGAMTPQDFLKSLDAYVYFHSANWVEAFGRAPLEALATGLPVILPESFRELFGEGALYGSPQDVAGIIGELRADEAKLHRQQDAALTVVRERFSVDRFAHRLADFCGLKPSGKGAAPAKRSNASRTVMFVSSNGIGLGHLTRQMAMARRLPPDLKPVFFTLSRAAALVRDQGYLVEHVPFHRYVGTHANLWNPVFAKELAEAILFHKPSTLVFDGNVPYAGLLDALATAPDMRRIWVRRAMWQHHHKNVLPRADKFDAIIEPAELAGEDDDGPTKVDRGKAHLVSPILMTRPEERLSRAEARRELGIGDEAVLVAFQLGSGNNFEFGPIRQALLSALGKHPQARILEIVSPIADKAEPWQPVNASHRILRLFPSFRLSNAFDFSVSAAGYNSFHESVLGGVPTLFVPNEAEEMDKQITRARYADRNNLARWIGARDIYGAAAKISEMSNPDTREAIREACGALSVGDGAMEAVRFVEESTLAIR